MEILIVVAIVGILAALAFPANNKAMNSSASALLNWKPPEPRPSIFYLYGNQNTTPAVFLDGHVELLPFAIPENMIIPAVLLSGLLF